MLAKSINKETMRLICYKLYSYATFNKVGSLVQVNLTKKFKYDVAFFKNNWRNQDFMITERIKRSRKTDQIEAIIQSVGMQMNIVHLTAILDRVEQQQMLNITKIINFVVNSLKNYQDFFTNITQDKVRTISNIICYLGNIKNKELNYIFQKIDLRLPLTKGNTIERTMLITGLIRLQLFELIFHTNPLNHKQKLSLSDVIGTQFSLTQILSIWYAYITEINYANKLVNDFFIELINQLDYKKAENYEISLISFTYATICYTKIYSSLTVKSAGKIFNIVSQRVPQICQKQNKLQPHEFTLLLESIKKLKEYRIKEQQQIVYGNGFKTVLQENFRQICLLHNVTLRNIANCYKSFNEFIGITQPMIEYSMRKMAEIIVQEMHIIQKKPTYNFNEKIDLLSFDSLFWKISSQYNFKLSSSEQKIALYEKFIKTVIVLIKELNKRALMHKFGNKELLMLYSGFYQLKRAIQINYDEDLKRLSVKEVTREERKFTVKQITLFYSYFRFIKFITPQFCQFIKKSLKKMKLNSDFQSNPKARQILANKICIMNSQKCLNCFSSFSKDELKSSQEKS